MKVFVKASELAGEKPTVIAFYPDSSDIGEDAHGEDMTVLTLPQNVIARAVGADGIPRGMPYLAEGWREKVGSMPIETEARRRIAEVFSAEDRIDAIHDVLGFIIKHGLDVAQWPEAAKRRWAEVDEAWRYIAEVRERARAHGPTVLNVRSDKIWPRRPSQSK